MNVSSYVKTREKDVEKILLDYGLIDHQTILDMLNAIVEQSYLEGAESMLAQQAGKKAFTNMQKNLKYKNLSNDVFFSSYRSLIKESLFRCFEQIGIKIKTNDKAIIEPLVENIMKTLYDIGFVNGVAVGRDNDMLAIYEKVKDEYNREQ